MSQKTNAANSTSTSISGTTSTATATIEPSAVVKQNSSLFGSLKKQKKKDEAAEERQSLNDNVNVVKRHHRDPTSSYDEQTNLSCLLLEDASIDCAPVHVLNLLRHFANEHLTSGEVLFLLVYIVALESGYVAQTDYEEEKFYLATLTATSSFHAKNVLHLSRHKPMHTRSDDLRRFTLKLRSLVDAENDCHDYLFSLLVGFVMGDLLIVTLSPANSTEGKGFSRALSIGRYVLSIQAKGKPLYQRFRKLQELTYILREYLFVPMRCQQLYWLNCSIYPSLDSLPAELYGQILQHLKKKQLKILANVNKSFYNITKNSTF